MDEQDFRIWHCGNPISVRCYDNNRAVASSDGLAWKPSILCTQGGRLLEPIPAVWVWRRGYILDRSPVYDMADTKRNNNHLSMKPTRKMLEYEIWTLIDWLSAWRSDDPKTGETERDWCWLLVLVFVIPPHSPLRPRFLFKEASRTWKRVGNRSHSDHEWLRATTHTVKPKCKKKEEKKRL